MPFKATDRQMDQSTDRPTMTQHFEIVQGRQSHTRRLAPDMSPDGMRYTFDTHDRRYGGGGREGGGVRGEDELEE